MNSSTYLYLVKFGPFYRGFGVGIFVRCHIHHEKCVDLVGGSRANFWKFTPRLGIHHERCMGYYDSYA